MIRHLTRKIKPHVECMLWGRAAGRCEFHGCNERLDKSSITQETVNIAQKAHIYAFSEDGPRGQKRLPAALLNEIGNLMLVCHQCHRKIDKEQSGGRYTASQLLAWKRAHERRIEIVTGIPVTKASHVVHYSANIDNHAALLDFTDTAGALFPDRHPATDKPIELGSSSSIVRDRDAVFWEQEERQLRGRFTHRVHHPIVDGDVRHLSVFALAPQPLLVLLGTLLTNINDVDVFAHHKEPKGWGWRTTKGRPLKFRLTKPSAERGDPALVVSVSGHVTTERVTAVMAAGSVWRVDVDDPHNDCLKTRGHLREFRQFMRKALDQIKAVHGQATPLHIFPAMPAAMAVELGRIRSPKADSAWRVYDQVNALGGFVAAITLDSKGSS